MSSDLFGKMINNGTDINSDYFKMALSNYSNYNNNC